MRLLRPDDVLWRYLSLREQLDSVPSRSMIVGKGLAFGERCKNCRAPETEARLERHDPESGASRWNCSDCGIAWPVNVAFLLRGGVQERRVSGHTDHLAELADLSKILSKLDKREQIIFLLLYQYEGLRAYAGIADALRARYPALTVPPGARGPRARAWSEWTVRRVVQNARSKIQRELRAGGWLPEILG